MRCQLVPPRRVISLCLSTLVCFTVIFILMAVYYVRSFKREPVRKTWDGNDFPRLPVKGQLQIPVVLLWTTFWNSGWGLGEDRPNTSTQFTSQRCGHVDLRCELVNDKKRFAESSVIVFHPHDTISPIPTTRAQWQHFVLFLEEPPPLSPSLKKYPDFFNWTMTYRSDSDFFAPYGRFRKIDTSKRAPSHRNYAEGKPNFVLLLTSHCEVESKRLNFAHALGKHIQVDIYGKCGLDCNTTCFQLIKKYKFYLAFENSICKDYVTEKLFSNGYGSGLVPIVMGGADNTDYKGILPMNSYIDVSNFSTPKALADYLVAISMNDTAYNQFFAWRNSFEVFSPGFNHYFCELCSLAWNNHSTMSTYTDIHSWWFDNACLTPEEKYPQWAPFL